MTKEDKQLLLKDLCARLPYNPIIVNPQLDGGYPYKLSPHSLKTSKYLDSSYIEDTKIYLRPMSSMTEEEKRDFSIFIGKTVEYRQKICLDSDSMCNPIIGGFKCVYWGLFDKCIDWLNAHHFDYRGLIPKGLAIAVTEDNNPYK